MKYVTDKSLIGKYIKFDNGVRMRITKEIFQQIYLDDGVYCIDDIFEKTHIVQIVNQAARE